MNKSDDQQAKEEPTMGQDNPVVSAARAHAASIRRTLWVKESKRLYDSTGTSAAGGTLVATRVADAGCKHGRDGSRNDEPPLIDGPIYSPAYWRAWQARAKAKSSRGPHAEGGEGEYLTAPERASTSSGIGAFKARKGLPSAPYSHPTSSFAGGKKSTPIFASASESEGLLRAHHDATIRPLLDSGAEAAGKRRCAPSTRAVRFSIENPRKENDARKASTDSMYDIRLADQAVLPTPISYSFRSGKPSTSESAIQGISRDTPGAVYNPSIGRSARSSPTTRLSSTDRFPVASKAFLTPGPGEYPVQNISMRDGNCFKHLRAVAWNGPETFADSPWCRSVPPPHLRNWQGFGNGCSVEEHVNYGACLDGNCCTRHSIEKRNALRVLQFQAKNHRSRSDARGREQRSGDQSSQSIFSVWDAGIENRSCGGKNKSDIRENSESDTKSGGNEKYDGKAGKEGRKKRPLHFATENGELLLVGRLCDQGDNRNAVDGRGRTPLHVAAEKGRTRIVDRLLEEDKGEKELETEGSNHV